MPAASSSDSEPSKPGIRPARDVAAGRVGEPDLEREARDDHADEHGDDRLEAAEAARLQREDHEGRDAGDQAGGEERDAEEQVEADRGADELGDVGRHRDRLGLQPEQARRAPAEALAAQLGQVPAGRDAELGAHRLDQHRHQVRGEDDPQQQVAVLRAAGDVGREVAGIDVGDRRDEGRAEERQQPADALALAAQRALGRLQHTRLARKRPLRRRCALVGRGGVIVTR